MLKGTDLNRESYVVPNNDLMDRRETRAKGRRYDLASITQSRLNVIA